MGPVILPRWPRLLSCPLLAWSHNHSPLRTAREDPPCAPQARQQYAPMRRRAALHVSVYLSCTTSVQTQYATCDEHLAVVQRLPHICARCSLSSLTRRCFLLFMLDARWASHTDAHAARSPLAYPPMICWPHQAQSCSSHERATLAIIAVKLNTPAAAAQVARHPTHARPAVCSAHRYPQPETTPLLRSNTPPRTHRARRQWGREQKGKRTQMGGDVGRKRQRGEEDQTLQVADGKRGRAWRSRTRCADKHKGLQEAAGDLRARVTVSSLVLPRLGAARLAD
ncbi:hypothetical protein B0H19DRAFT_1288959 [Mycena capillaripes]|nr:hypothetical protein B0H19DRAFT_1288959 [Mycena capillaripes]